MRIPIWARQRYAPRELAGYVPLTAAVAIVSEALGEELARMAAEIDALIDGHPSTVSPSALGSQQEREARGRRWLKLKLQPIKIHPQGYLAGGKLLSEWPAIILTRDGSKLPIPQEMWASEDVEYVFACGGARFQFGYSSQSSEGPAYINEAWLMAELSGVGNNGKPQSGPDAQDTEKTPSTAPTARPITTTQMERFYKDYVAAAQKEGRQPSRDEDWEAMKWHDPNITRDRVRELRNEFAPSEWREGGRRPGGKSGEN